MTDARPGGGPHPRPDAEHGEALSTAQILQARYRGRLPGRLEDLAGPGQGVVTLPLHVVWSGRNSFPLDQPRARMSLYRVVLAEGQHQDLVRFLNKDLLVAQWPVLRRMVSRHLRTVWEEAFPELASVVDCDPSPGAPPHFRAAGP
ncbi:hypothetical protein ACIBCP_32520 [Streptomyces sp. NPDC051287]|uniref:hypothetical protein n=1 Tax=Streptomyces sp. NPDC051287 TaxID=3365648 RepID=UPI0037A14565